MPKLVPIRIITKEGKELLNATGTPAIGAHWTIKAENGKGEGWKIIELRPPPSNVDDTWVLVAERD